MDVAQYMKILFDFDTIARREFHVVCKELSGRVLSAEFQQKGVFIVNLCREGPEGSPRSRPSPRRRHDVYRELGPRANTPTPRGFGPYANSASDETEYVSIACPSALGGGFLQRNERGGMERPIGMCIKFGHLLRARDEEGLDFAAPSAQAEVILVRIIEWCG
jgi:hypothetical protein